MLEERQAVVSPTYGAGCCESADCQSHPHSARSRPSAPAGRTIRRRPPCCRGRGWSGRRCRRRGRIREIAVRCRRCRRYRWLGRPGGEGQSCYYYETRMMCADAAMWEQSLEIRWPPSIGQLRQRRGWQRDALLFLFWCRFVMSTVNDQRIPREKFGRRLYNGTRCVTSKIPKQNEGCKPPYVRRCRSSEAMAILHNAILCR
mmetsp:Transcript_11042/g.31012  ORF Transcript_11042/g.31012 Transcript_11042/m.31012 type:complete len:202 (-) Transcript_11042:73-678(-)